MFRGACMITKRSPSAEPCALGTKGCTAQHADERQSVPAILVHADGREERLPSPVFRGTVRVVCPGQLFELERDANGPRYDADEYRFLAVDAPSDICRTTEGAPPDLPEWAKLLGEPPS